MLRKIELLLGLASLGALTLGCNGSELVTPPEKPAAEHAGKSSAALAGLDGNVTLSLPDTVVNQYTTLSANAALGATTLSVASVAALANGGDALGAGDLVLVIQMQGATLQTATNDVTWGQVSAIGNAGSYEFAEVTSVDSGANTVSLSCALSHAYTSAGQVQVVRVPQYDTLTIGAGASIVAPAWNGTSGGVVAVHAKTTLNLAGSIDVSGRGFRGGAIDDNTASQNTNTTTYASASDTNGAQKGEGVGGFLAQFGRGPAGNGGGGGNSHNGGGGGGANARSGGAWTGQGVFDLSVTGGATAWLIDPNYSATASEGGGRGGYTFSNSDQNALTLVSGDVAWGGNRRRQRGGLGGHPLDNDAAARVFFGGGGGAGDGNNGHSGAGGAGGGIVFVLAGAVTGTGSILANGAAGVNADSTSGGLANGDSPGGGGGGGAVIVSTTALSTISVQANGGVGGNQIVANADEAEGPGGGGGGGFVALTGTATTSVLGGGSGTTTSPAVTEFPVNGATRGGTGQALTNAVFVPAYCADLGVPSTTIVTRPDDPTNDTTGDFTFTSDDGTATFECLLDAGSYVPCPATFATSALADGSHTLSVRAKDTVGNVDATPESYTWVVDTNPPETFITDQPNDPTADTTGDFAFDSDEPGSTFECRVDGGAFADCSSPFVTGALAEGSHTFEVRATDEAGNVDATPATFTWEVDADAGLDDDDDGISNEDEGILNTDPNDADTDDDGVPDGTEASPGVDSDGDGLINIRDPDSDNDGLFDGTELGLDCDGSGTDASRGNCRADADPASHTDPLDPDTDGGGVRDGSEDTNLNGDVESGETDPTTGHEDDDDSVVDTDGDGLSDGLEGTLHSDPNDKDSDDDGAADGVEPNPSADSDRDGLVDVLDVDSDNDGLLDGTELGLDCDGEGTDASLGHCRADADSNSVTSAVNPDTDYGGKRDGSEDTNLDGELDGGEQDPTSGHGADDAAVVDSDGDGLSDELEDTLGSDPDDIDSDDDGLFDGAEPNPSDDRDGDGLIDLLDPDSDDDGLFDGTEAGQDCDDDATDEDANVCIADVDANTTTHVLVADTDRGGVIDGMEDTNHDGQVDPEERNPLDGMDDSISGGEGGAGGEAGSPSVGGSAGTSGNGGNAGSAVVQGGSAGVAGAGGTAGTSATGGTGGTDAGGTGGTAGIGGTGGTGGGGGTDSAGGTGGTTSGAAGTKPDSHVVVLGGGLCAVRPGGDGNTSWLIFAAAALMRTLRLRRRATPRA